MAGHWSGMGGSTLTIENSVNQKVCTCEPMLQEGLTKNRTKQTRNQRKSIESLDTLGSLVL